MHGDVPEFADLMLAAHRAAMALDEVTKRDGPKALAAALNGCKSVCSRLLDYQRTAYMTRAEANALQTTVDQLQERLRFFGDAA
jgi:hypothetical protein